MIAILAAALSIAPMPSPASIFLIPWMGVSEEHGPGVSAAECRRFRDVAEDGRQRGRHVVAADDAIEACALRGLGVTPFMKDDR